MTRQPGIESYGCPQNYYYARAAHDTGSLQNWGTAIIVNTNTTVLLRTVLIVVCSTCTCPHTSHSSPNDL